MSNRVLNYIISGEDLLSPKMAGTAARMQAIGKSMTKYVTLPIVGIAAASTKLAVDFNGSMNKINALVGISQQQVSEWSKQVLDLARVLPQSPKELADALYYVTSAGFRGTEAMNVLTISSKAAAAGLGETMTVANAVTSALNAYHMSGDKASSVTDTLVAAVTQGKMPAEELAGAIGTVLPVAAEMGVSFEEVAGTAASLSRSGADVRRTMTGLRFLLSSLENPASAAVKILAKVGISADDIRKSIADKGLLPTLQMLKDKLPTPDFLKVVGGARGVVTALGLVGKNADQVAKVMGNVKDATGATETAFESASKTAGFKFKAALSSLQATAIQIGSKIAPALATVAGWLAKVADWFGKLPDPAQNAIMAIAGIAAVIGPLLILSAKMVTAFKILKGAVAAFGVASKIAAVGNPWILLATVIATVALLIITHWNKVKQVSLAVWHGILAVVQGVWRWIKANWPYLLGVITGPIGMATVLVVKNWGQIKSAAASAFNAVLSWFKSLPGRIVGAIGNVGRTLWNIGSSLIGGMLGGITGALRNIGSWIKAHIFDPIVNGIKSLFGIHSPSTVMASIGSHLITGLITGLIKSNPAQIIGKVFGSLPNALGALVGKGLVAIEQLPGKALNALVSAGKAVGGFFSKLFGGGGSNQLDSWISTALAIARAPADWLPALKVLVGKESGGNPNAVNTIAVGREHASGLFQTLPSTFAAYAIKGLGGIFNPIANAVAGIRYIMARYGSPWNIPNLFSAGTYAAKYVGYAQGTASATRGWHWVGEEGRELAYFSGGETVLSARRSAAMATPNLDVTLNARIVFPGGRSAFAKVIVDDVEYGRAHGVHVPWPSTS